MSDFTKEELKNIAFYIQVSDSTYRRDGYAFLKSKINSMIESYCDHEWENICCQCALDQIYCHKCEKTLDDN